MAIKVRFIPIGLDSITAENGGLYIEKQLECLPPISSYIRLKGDEQVELGDKIQKAIGSDIDWAGIKAQLELWFFEGEINLEDMNFVRGYEYKAYEDIVNCVYVELNIK